MGAGEGNTNILDAPGVANNGLSHPDPVFLEASRGGVLNLDILGNTMPANAYGPEFTFATLTLRTLAGGVMGTAINANIRSNAITLQNAAAQFVEPIWFDIDTTAPGTAIRLEGNAGGTNASPVTFLNANNTFTPATGSSMWNGVVGNVGNAAPSVLRAVAGRCDRGTGGRVAHRHAVVGRWSLCWPAAGDRR